MKSYIVIALFKHLNVEKYIKRGYYEYPRFMFIQPLLFSNLGEQLFFLVRAFTLLANSSRATAWGCTLIINSLCSPPSSLEQAIYYLRRFFAFRV